MNTIVAARHKYKLLSNDAEFFDEKIDQDAYYKNLFDNLIICERIKDTANVSSNQDADHHL